MRSLFSVRTITSFSPLAAALFAAASSTFSSADRPHPWQRGFQLPASPIIEGIVAFHDDLRIFLTAILCFVRYLIAVILNRYSHPGVEQARPVDRLVHASVLEIV